ncbi:MAG: SIR2 family NAD-dependent protein deacylase [Armatimonadota bacterium]
MDNRFAINEKLIRALINAKRTFVFTGAGASKESGLPTFREIDGEWSRYDPMTFATFEGFISDPVKVWSLYRRRQLQIASAQPNPGHVTIARMESYYLEFLLCTQNVDDLHERAGSRKMVKLHGDAWQMRCLECASVYDTRNFDLPEEFTQETLPKCPRCSGLCRPNIVWFGEYVPQDAMNASIEMSSKCDLMLIVGTSGEVSGGYGFAQRAMANGATIIEVNPSEGVLSRYAQFRIPMPAGVALPKLWEEVTRHIS